MTALDTLIPALSILAIKLLAKPSMRIHSGSCSRQAPCLDRSHGAKTAPRAHIHKCHAEATEQGKCPGHPAPPPSGALGLHAARPSSRSTTARRRLKCLGREMIPVQFASCVHAWMNVTPELGGRDGEVQVKLACIPLLPPPAPGRDTSANAPKFWTGPLQARGRPNARSVAQVPAMYSVPVWAGRPALTFRIYPWRSTRDWAGLSGAAGGWTCSGWRCSVAKWSMEQAPLPIGERRIHFR